LASLSSEEKERILKAIEEDRGFRYALMGLLGYSEVLERISRIEERIVAIEERQQRIEEGIVKLEERQQKLEERFARLEERQQRIEEALIELRKSHNELVKRMASLEKLVVTIAHRYGVITEVSFREAMSGILTRYFGASASKWSVYDEEGIVYGYPSMVDADVIIKDNVHIIVEIKSRADLGDLVILHRIGKLYEKKTGVKPRLAIVAGFITDKAREAASRYGIEVYGYLERGYDIQI